MHMGCCHAWWFWSMENGRPPLADSRSNQLEVGKLLQLSPSSKTNRGHLKNKEAVVDVGAAEVWSGAAAKAITNAREVQ